MSAGRPPPVAVPGAACAGAIHDPALDGGARLPAWLSTTVEVALCVVLAYALTALPLAMAGVLHPAVTAVATAVVGTGLLVTVAPGDRRKRALAPWATTAAGAALVGGVLFAAWSAHFSSEHVLADRDPGVYLWFGRWLADHGSLLLDNQIHLFPAGHGGSIGQCPVTCPGAPGNRLYVQYLHLPSLMLAVGAWLGGSALMVKVNALLAGLSLVVFYCFATRLLRPAFALLAAAALGVNLVEVYFARDTWSEILAQLLLFGGLFELWEARSAWSARRGAVAGLLLGAGCMARIDAFLYLIPLGAYGLVEYGLASADGPGQGAARRRHFAIAAMAGVAVTAAIATVDLFVFSRGYYRLQSHQLHAIAFAFGAVIVVGVGLLSACRRGVRWTMYLRRVRAHAAIAVPLLIIALALFALFIRPQLEHPRGPPSLALGGIQRKLGLPIDRGRTYVEDSMRWLEWYLGPVALAAGVVGFALAIGDALRGRVARAALPFLGILGLVTALYVLQPSIFPDQIQAMRRFLPVTIPGLLLCAAWLAQRALDWLRGRRPAPLRVAVALLLAAGIVAVPAAQTAGLADIREQAGGLRAIARVCASLPPHAVVWSAARVLLEPVHVFCGVPAARPPARAGERQVRAFATQLRSRGRRLVLLSTNRTFLRQALGAGAPRRPIAVLVYRHLEPTLTERPTSRVRVRVAFWAATVGA